MDEANNTTNGINNFGYSANVNKKNVRKRKNTSNQHGKFNKANVKNFYGNPGNFTSTYSMIDDDYEIKKSVRDSIYSSVHEYDNKNSEEAVVDRYFIYLAKDLINNNILTEEELVKLKSKLRLGLIQLPETISKLEKLTKLKINNDISGKMTKDFYKPVGSDISNNWTSIYTVLDTDKWTVPIVRPPKCLHDTIKKEKIINNIHDNTFIPLDIWDDSRNIFNKTE